MQQLRFIGSHPERLFGVDGLRQCSDGVGGRMELGDWSTGSDGLTALGATGVFADEILGYALMSSLSPGAWSISTEIWLDLVGELPAPGGALTGHARPLAPGSFSVGEIRDEQGRAVVLCRQRGRLAPSPVDGADFGPAPDEGRAVGMEAALGLRAEGDLCVMPMRAELVNPRGMLHGGVSLAASEVVASRFRLDQGCRLRTSSVHIVHTRGVPLGEPVAFHATAHHVGRSLFVTQVVGTVGGKVATVATVTAEG